MNYWKVILATVVIFGAGVVTGGLLVNSVERGPHAHFWFWRDSAHRPMNRRGASRAAPLPRPRSPELWRKEFMGHLDRALDLTPQQRATIARIIAAGQERNREIWTNVAPKMRREMQRVHQRIRAQLTPAQQKKFKKLLKRFAGHHPPHRSQPPRPPSTNRPPPHAGGATGP